MIVDTLSAGLLTLLETVPALPEERLAQDPRLAEELAALRALVAEAGALPRSVEPERDLWPEIDREIRRGRVTKVDFGRWRRDSR